MSSTPFDEVLAGRPAGYTDLPRLEYTRRILTETLRLRQPTPVLTLMVSEDTELGGYQLSAGTIIICSLYLIHHRADLYDNPEHFDPDRWDPDHTAPPQEAYVPFGAGPRKCSGDNFAMTEATPTLATIANRWDLKTLPGSDARPAKAISLRPRKLQMRLTARPPQKETQMLDVE